MRSCMVAAVLAVMAYGCGCAKPPEQDAQYVLLGTDLSFDHYLTWFGYRGYLLEDASLAIFMYDGQWVGQGQAGFQKVLNLIERLPAGASVLIFPDNRGLGDGVLFLPFDMERLARLAAKKRISLITRADPSSDVLSRIVWTECTRGRDTATRPDLTGTKPFKLNELGLEFDHYVTWFGYYGQSLVWGKPDAFYLYDGEVIGQGDKAFQEVLTRIRGAEAGSRLLVSPFYGDKGGRLSLLPFKWSSLLAAVREKDMVLLKQEDPTFLWRAMKTWSSD